MYGDMLKPPSPMGTPPPVGLPAAGPTPSPAMPPGPVGAAAPGPTPSPVPGPTPIPPAVLAASQAKQQAGQEAAQRAAYEQHLDQFLWHAAQDYAAHRIGRDDLKKAAAYTGTEPYASWRNDNIQHLKETTKAKDQ